MKQMINCETSLKGDKREKKNAKNGGNLKYLNFAVLQVRFWDQIMDEVEWECAIFDRFFIICWRHKYQKEELTGNVWTISVASIMH